MKFVTWNCNGALRKKYTVLDELDADILIIQECEDPSLSTRAYVEWAGDHLWTGKSKHKGIGVFSKKGITLKKLDWPDEGLQQFLPIRVNDSFNLLAVWAMQAQSPTYQYIGQFWKYLQLNKVELAESNTVICGDFNSNVIWDKKRRHWNHGDVVRELSDLGILSMYHQTSGERQGEETQPTLYMHRKLERPYHIDYVFVAKNLLNGGTLEIGHPDKWLSISDHMPIMFNLPLQTSKDSARDESRSQLREKIWEILPREENQYRFDDNNSGTEYTHNAIMDLWEKGLCVNDDRKKAVLLLHMIMFHDRMNSESGNFKFIDEHKDLIESILLQLT